jgi:TnpA family transposase
MVFGIFSILGFRFAPRFADLGDQRFWRADVPSGDAPSGEGPDEETASGYGALEAIARSKSNRTKIQTQWSGMVRVAGDQPGPCL